MFSDGFIGLDIVLKFILMFKKVSHSVASTHCCYVFLDKSTHKLVIGLDNQSIIYINNMSDRLLSNEYRKYSLNYHG